MGAFMSQLFAGCALQPKGTMPGMCMCVFVVGGGGSGWESDKVVKHAG
jgi:hypothetical protein